MAATLAPVVPTVVTPREALDRLTALTPAGLPDGGLIVSCYQRLEFQDRMRQSHRTDVRNRADAVRDRLAALELDRSALRQVEGDLAAVERWLSERANLPATRGVALFACSAIDLFLAVPLPRVATSRLDVADTAFVGGLTVEEAALGTVVALLLGGDEVRAWAIEPPQTHELAALHVTAPPQPDRGRDPADHDRTLGEVAERNRRVQRHQRLLQAAADALTAFHRETPLQGLLIAGTGQNPDELADLLGPDLRPLLIGCVTVDAQRVTPAELERRTAEAWDAWQCRRDLAAVDMLTEATGPGLAAWGVDDVGAALLAGQVRTLYVDPEARLSGWRCPSSGRLALTPDLCTDPEGAVAVPDVVDDLIEETLRQGGAVHAVRDPAARTRLTPVAAHLRFRL